MLSACRFAVTRAAIAVASFAAIRASALAVVNWIAAILATRHIRFFFFRLSSPLSYSLVGTFELMFRKKWNRLDLVEEKQ